MEIYDREYVWSGANISFLFTVQPDRSHYSGVLYMGIYKVRFTAGEILLCLSNFIWIAVFAYDPDSMPTILN